MRAAERECWVAMDTPSLLTAVVYRDERGYGEQVGSVKGRAEVLRPRSRGRKPLVAGGFHFLSRVRLSFCKRFINGLLTGNHC